MGVLGVFLKVITNIFSVLPLAVQVAEILGGLFRPGQKSGEQKLQAVRAIVKQAIEVSELVAGKDIIDEQLLDQGIGEITNGAVKVLNAVRPKT
jgi:hypothetical protein